MNEAKAAVASAQSLGLATPVIYKDVENYYGPTLCTSTQQAAAGAAVQAFVSGWDSQLHSTANGSGNFLAGVYANPTPIATDISAVSPLPDDIWIAQANGLATVWNVGTKYGMTDNMWPNSQRIHQFLIDQAGVTWGGTALKIDEDIDNATIANANQGSKRFSSVSVSSLAYPGACATWAYGINGMSGGAFINGSGLTGEIVGAYTQCGGGSQAFLDNNGQFSNVSYPGSMWSIAYGINNLGQIVGAWQDSAYCVHGYLLSSGKYTSIDNPNAVCVNGGTWLSGINDAGQISGFYIGQSAQLQGFLYYGNTFYAISPPSSCCYNFTGVGINGEANMAGSYVNAPYYNGFVEIPTPPSWTGPYSSFFDANGLETVGSAIDENGDVAGYYEFQYLDDYALLFSNGVQFLSFQYAPGDDTYGLGVNDFGQMVGYYSLPAGGGTYGFLAILSQ